VRGRRRRFASSGHRSGHFARSVISRQSAGCRGRQSRFETSALAFENASALDDRRVIAVDKFRTGSLILKSDRTASRRRESLESDRPDLGPLWACGSVRSEAYCAAISGHLVIGASGMLPGRMEPKACALWHDVALALVEAVGGERLMCPLTRTDASFGAA
jgi:hypothetical protein